MDLVASGIRRSFDAVTVLMDCSVRAGPCENCAITGTSGSGKSTLLQIVAGMDRPDAGTVLWDGVDIYACSQRKRNRLFQQHIGWLSQAPLLDPQVSALDNCLLPTVFRPGRQTAQRARTLLERVGLAAVMDHPAGTLSGGQQVRCALARALVTRPVLVIADEPTGTLDTDTAEMVADLLLELSREEGFALLLATHDRPLAGRCHHHLHLEEGCCGPAAAVLA